MGKHHLVEALGVDLLLDVGLCPQVLVVQLGLEAICEKQSEMKDSPNNDKSMANSIPGNGGNSYMHFEISYRFFRLRSRLARVICKE